MTPIKSWIALEDGKEVLHIAWGLEDNNALDVE